MQAVFEETFSECWMENASFLLCPMPGHQPIHANKSIFKGVGKHGLEILLVNIADNDLRAHMFQIYIVPAEGKKTGTGMDLVVSDNTV